MSLFGLLLLVYSIIRIDDSLPFPSKWALIPVLGTLLVISSGSKAWLNRVLLMNPISIFFGLISYPLYLWHWPILSFLRIVEGETPNEKARIIAVLLSIILAWVTYRYIEQPIRFGAKKREKSFFLIGLLAIVGSAALMINTNDGITHFNKKLKYISDAKGDWEFPKGLVKNKGYLSTSSNPAKILIFGDSHVEAFAPRIVDQYQKGLIEEVAFVTRGGCAPLPNSYRDEKKISHCASHFTRLFEALEMNPIDVIILGGSYRAYFKSSKSIFIDADEKKHLISSETGRNNAFDSFYNFVEELSKKYKVVVMSHAAADRKFSPSSILESSNKRRRIPVGEDLNDAPFSIDRKLESEMSASLKILNVDFISQSETVCPNSLCYPLTEDGKPKYKDSSHMRPFFVKEYMDLLDPYILLPKQSREAIQSDSNYRFNNHGDH